MSGQVSVRKGITEVMTVNVGMDVSTDTLKSQIRAEPFRDSVLIAEWDIAFATDGTDGELILTMDDVITAQIEARSGYMDILRISGGEPYTIFSPPLEVVFQGTISREVEP